MNNAIMLVKVRYCLGIGLLLLSFMSCRVTPKEEAIIGEVTNLDRVITDTSIGGRKVICSIQLDDKITYVLRGDDCFAVTVGETVKIQENLPWERWRVIQ